MKTEQDLDYHVTDDDIEILNSYAIKKRSMMKYILRSIKEEYGDSTQVFKKRSMSSLRGEWRAHNLLYDLHLFRSHTSDVDLNVGENFIKRVGYRILGYIYLLIHW